MRWIFAMLLAVVVVASSKDADAGSAAPNRQAEFVVVPDIEARVAQFARRELTADLSGLTRGERRALERLVRAAKLVHRVYLRQAWRGSPALARQLARWPGPQARPAREYFRIMAQPWDELRRHEPFLGWPPRPAGAGFYPEDLTREEFDRWLAAHPADREAFESPTTVIERRPGGALVAAPYSVAYGDLLRPIAAELRRAAAASGRPSLARFLRLRAAALASNDYFDSDLAWMDLDGPLEVVVGPYETYLDDLFGYKASFEAFVCVVQAADSARLARYKHELPFLERNLPLPDQHKNFKRGEASPIRVADVVYAAGDARAGVQTLAFNLPNDERVREAKGSKKVLLKNMMEAKYSAILAPIARRVLPSAEADRIDSDTFFHFILFHELSHGLGPGRITVAGRASEVRLELRDLYAAIEEAKADVLAVYNLYALADKGVVPGAVIGPLPWTYAAGLFRAARFGTAEAHGLGVVIQANYLLAHGALEVTREGRFRPLLTQIRPAIEGLARELLMIEATGDYAGAQRLVKTYGTPPPALLGRLEDLAEVPVDVDPLYVLFERR